MVKHVPATWIANLKFQEAIPSNALTSKSYFERDMNITMLCCKTHMLMNEGSFPSLEKLLERVTPPALSGFIFRATP